MESRIGCQRSGACACSDDGRVAEDARASTRIAERMAGSVMSGVTRGDSGGTWSRRLVPRHVTYKTL